MARAESKGGLDPLFFLHNKCEKYNWIFSLIAFDSVYEGIYSPIVV